MRKTIEVRNSGIYILEIKALKPFFIHHPKFSSVKLLPGFYFYIGSAQKNLLSRLNRHLSKKKKLHWHIDFVTSNPQVEIQRIFVLANANQNFEPLTAKFFINKNYKIPLEGFGSSDDKTVKSHLFYSPKKLHQSQLTDLYHSIVCLIPSSVDNSGRKFNSDSAFEMLQVHAS